MKKNFLFQKIMRALLVITMLGSFLAIPTQTRGVLAKSPSAAFTTCAAQGQIPAAECDALVALYNSANGAGWTDHTGWLQTDTPCSWARVTCGNGTNVTALYLFSNALSGSIPTQLDNLTNLTDLELNNNRLSGSIPAQLGNLTNLTWLDLSWNQLSGSIPTQLGNLTQLYWLELSSNQLSGSIPTQLGNLTKLTYLRLYFNQLSGPIPTQLGGLTQLQELSLFENQLSGSIPTQLGGLTKLTMLVLSHNQLSGSIPSQLGNMTKLSELYLNNNQLSGSIPAGLANLKNIWWLDLSWNQLSGSIPIQLFNMTQLINLYLGNNQLSGSLPTQLGNMTKLDVLHLDNNRLTGEIPASITKLTSLNDLTLSCGLDSSNPAVIAFINRMIPGWQDQLCLPVATLISIADQDGWIIESSETSGVGGARNNTAIAINLGDNQARRQYLGILSFASGAALPDTAVITGLTLKVKKQGVTGGGDPLATFQGFMVDIKNGFFGSTSVLQIADFQAAAGNTYGPFTPAPVSNWYTLDLTGAGPFVNKLTANSGLTQIRLRFKLDDNNDAVANYLSLFSGSAPAVDRPQLIVTYYVP